jgi:ribosomal protein S18 acetylase RimI-like enzyme
MPLAPGLTLRRAEPRDAAQVAELNRRLATESEGLELDPQRIRAGVEALLADAAKGLYLVVEEGQRVVGQLMLTIEWSDWRNGPIHWLQSVYVMPEHRGSGVFRALWDEAVRIARAAGAPAMRLYVEETNVAAQEVYRRVGMHRSSYQIFEKEPP